MDNLLLLLFALPIATIILESVLEALLHCPIKVASIFFAIFLIVTFAFFDATFLIFAIIYTIIAFLAAVITRFIIKLIRTENSDNNETTTSATINTVNATINAENLSNGLDNNSCGCNNNTRYRRF